MDVSLRGVWIDAIPRRPLEPLTRYVGVARGDERDLAIEFVTGAGPDRGPPAFVGAKRVRATEISFACEAPNGGTRVEVAFDAATDDSSPGDIEYLVHRTRGPGVVAPQLRARVRNFAASEITAAFVLTDGESEGASCVSVVAIDGVGNVAGTGEELCFTPTSGIAFASCAVSAHPASTVRGVAVAAVVVAVAAAFRRSGRRRWGDAAP